MELMQKKIGKLDNKKNISGADSKFAEFLASNRDALSEKKILFKDLRISPENTYASTDSEINDLVASISSIGLLERFIVEAMPDGRYDILSGQKRFKAISIIREEEKSIYDKWFPDDSITCTVIDLGIAHFIGESNGSKMSTDNKRRFIITSANIQHEKTARDYMIQFRAKRDFYKEQKAMGLVRPGMYQRDFYAELLDVAPRSIQKLMNADKSISVDMWEKLERFDDLKSFEQLEAIAKLSEAGKDRLYQLITSKADFDFAAFLKDPVPEEAGEKSSDSSFTVGMQLTSKDISKMLGIDKLRKSVSLTGKKEIRGKDVEKLKALSVKLQKNAEAVDKILKKYR